MIDREALNRFECVAPRVRDEHEHFEICPVCGQAVDCRNLGDVFYHDEPGHKPFATH